MFWKRKKNMHKNPFYNQRDYIVMYVQCDNCGEVFRSHIRKSSELLSNFQGKASYILNKELIGSKCPNRINIYAEFTSSFKPLNYEINGGHFITKEIYEEYEQKEKEERE
ncbi:MAG: hypothetical protein J7K69_00235 [Thermotogae bacterium]|nr:hypothetical protein [Thermotogota bacterium]